VSEPSSVSESTSGRSGRGSDTKPATDSPNAAYSSARESETRARDSEIGARDSEIRGRDSEEDGDSESSPPSEAARESSAAPESGTPPSGLPDSSRSVPALAQQRSESDARSLVQLDPLRAYFSEISQYPLLSRREEHSLAVRVHDDNDPKAAQKLVLSNLRLVVKIAMEYKRVWTNLLDLIQEGNVGLLQAVRRFDPHRGVKLSSYSAYWIRAYILKYLIDNIRTVRIGSSRAERKLFFALNRAKRELEREGFKPEPLLLAERLDVKPEEVESMERRLAQSDLSLDVPVGDESGAATLGDLQAADLESAEEIVSDHDLRSTLRRHAEAFCKDLDEREQQILWDRLLADEPKTLQEIGDQFGLTRERVRQIEKKLIQRLGDYMRANAVDFEYWSDQER